MHTSCMPPPPGSTLGPKKRGRFQPRNIPYSKLFIILQLPFLSLLPFSIPFPFSSPLYHSLFFLTSFIPSSFHLPPITSIFPFPLPYPCLFIYFIYYYYYFTSSNLSNLSNIIYSFIYLRLIILVYFILFLFIFCFYFYFYKIFCYFTIDS